MKGVEGVLGGIALLILVYLLLSAPGAFQKIATALGQQGIGVIGTLQGRSVSGSGGYTVGGSTLGGIGGGF